jgi:hypothetical protein
MIPGLRLNQNAPVGIFALGFFLMFFIWLPAFGSTAAEPPAAPTQALTASCLPSGDGFLKAQLRGSIEASIDWPNAGTRCEGEERPNHEGVRMSFRREPGAAPDLLFVFGISRVRENQNGSGLAVNLTVILQGSSRIFGTRGDSRCTIDSLRQRRLEPDASEGTAAARHYRIEARGFCTVPAHAVRGEGSVLLTTFDFAGAVTFDRPEHPT